MRVIDAIAVTSAIEVFVRAGVSARAGWLLEKSITITITIIVTIAPRAGTWQLGKAGW